MLEPIMVRCTSKEVKETWLDHLTRILKLNRPPAAISTAPQVYQCSSDAGRLGYVGRTEMQLQRFSSFKLPRSAVCRNIKFMRKLVQQNEVLLQQWTGLSKLQSYICRMTSQYSLCDSDMQSLCEHIFVSFEHFQPQPCLDLMFRCRLTSQMPNSNPCEEVNIFCGRKLLAVKDSSAPNTEKVFPLERSPPRLQAVPVSASRSGICSDSEKNKDSKLRRKRGLFVRQDAFDMGDEDILDENQNYVFNVP